MNTPTPRRHLRSVASDHLRRGRHLQPVRRDCGNTADQLDLFESGCDTHGTPAGRGCALCLDQLDMFTPDGSGPGGDAA